MRPPEFVAGGSEGQVAWGSPTGQLVFEPKVRIVLLRTVPFTCGVCRSSELHCGVI